MLVLSLQVVWHLIAAGHDVHVVTGAPDSVFTSNIQSPNLYLRKVSLESGYKDEFVLNLLSLT